MPVELHFGMDHQHYDWTPFNQSRGVLRWPENARVALCVIVNLEHMEWSVPEGAFQAANLAGGYGPSPFPDVTRWSHREYGHRVGIFRLLDLLEKHGIKATVAMDALTAEHYPFLVAHCQGRGCEIIGHGISVSRMITSNMTEQEEREYIQTSLEALTRATGTAPAGWLGPGVRRIGQNAPDSGPGGNPLCLRLDQRRAAVPVKDPRRRTAGAACDVAGGRH